MVICWDFPPHNAIGGRRWAKIAKSLLKAGHQISVITSQMEKPSQKLSWISEREFESMHMYYLKSHLLVRWLNNYESPFKFVRIRVARLLLSRFFRGTIFDRAIGIEKCFAKLAGEVIRKNAIDTIFVTGAPFNLVYYAARLKNKFPRVRIVADYRDPWINAQNYGMQNLSPAQKAAELKKQNLVFEHVDVVTAPNSFLLGEIKDTYTGSSSQLAKFIELPHAFDPDDKIETTASARHDKIKIVYGGTLYLGIDHHLELFNAAITRLRQQFSEKQLEVYFYTGESDKQSLFSENADCVTFHKSIGEKIFEEIASADFILILLAEHNKNYVTSKYYEFLPYNKPYLYVGPQGFVSDKTVREGFGYHLQEPDDLRRIIVESSRNGFSMPLADISRFTFDAVTGKFLTEVTE